MKVQHIISESELKEWNPKDALMKKFGSKTAATKMDIDAETKAITKDFEAYYKNTPDGTPTTDLLFSFLKKKGLPITSPKDILAVLNKVGKYKPKGFMGYKAIGRGAQAVMDKGKKGLDAVNKGWDAVGNIGAKAMPTKEPVTSSMYDSVIKTYTVLEARSEYNKIKEDALQPQDVKKIINYYVKSGFQGTADVGAKSKYGGGEPQPVPDAPTTAEPTTAEPEADTPIPKGTKSEVPDGVDEFTADGNGGWIAHDGTPLKPDHPFNKKLDALVRSKPAAKKGTNPAGAKLSRGVKKAISTVKGAGFKVTSNDGAEL